MATADSRPEKESFLLVTFSSGDGLTTFNKYTNWDQDYLGHASTPAMDLDIPPNEGVLSERQLRIEIPSDVFTLRLSNGTPTSPTFVEVQEFSVGLTPGETTGVRVLFTGKITKTVQNFQGKSDLVAIFCKTRKGRLDIPLGLQCNHQCVWNLFLGHCGAIKASHSFIAEIDSVDGLEVTAANAGIALQATDDRYWKRGYLEKDGMRISIREYDGSVDVTKFHMADAPPTDWIGGAGDITFVAGCDKTVEVCRARFNQEDTFMGIGYGILPYNPLTESSEC